MRELKPINTSFDFPTLIKNGLDWSFNDEKVVKRYVLSFMLFADADVVGEKMVVG